MTDWVDDATLSREETLSRFEALNPESNYTSSPWHCARCGKDAKGCRCCVLCNKTGITPVSIYCLNPPHDILHDHDQVGWLCFTHQYNMFALNKGANSHCSLCVPDEETRARVLADPELAARHRLAWAKRRP